MLHYKTCSVTWLGLLQRPMLKLNIVTIKTCVQLKQCEKFDIFSPGSLQIIQSTGLLKKNFDYPNI